MKKLKLTFFIVLIGMLVVSCSRDITEPTMSANPSAPAIADVALTASFTVANADSLLRFSWSASDFGFTSSTSYTVEMSPKSDFSSNVASLFSTQNLYGTYKVGDANTLLLSWNFNIGSASTVYYRVAASVGTNVAKVYSNIKSKSLTPYDAVINYPMIYVPGGYQGWSPGAENGRLYAYGFGSLYQGIIRVKEGTNANTEFKVTINPNWGGPNYGGTLAKAGNNYSGTLSQTGGNYSVTSGVYAFSVDINILSITLTKTDDWGIIGSAVPPYDWSKDVDLFYNGQRKVWEITADFHAGEFKFRANDDWAVNYGDNGADGTLEQGGSNIALASAGNYTIRFDAVKLTYTVKKN